MNPALFFLSCATMMTAVGLVAATGTGHEAPSDPASAPQAVQSLHGGEAMDANQQERIDTGYRISPVDINLDGRNPRLVGLGSYLVNAGGACNDCHTNPTYMPGGDPFLGEPEQVNAVNFLAGGKSFGPFISRNITPDPISGLPGGRTYDEFVLMMRNGHDFDCTPGTVPGCPILQVMPWPYHANLTETDLQAIYAYLGAIPHADPASNRGGGQP